MKNSVDSYNVISSTMVYDIIVNDNNELQLNLYNVSLINRRVNKKKISFYSFELISENVLDISSLPSCIEKLRKEKITSKSSYTPSDFLALAGGVKNSFRALLLPISHKLLEQIYDEVIIDNVCYIYLYITYVNVKTGEVKALKISDFGSYSLEKEEYLNQSGYKHIGSSFLGHYLDTFNSKEEKPFSLTRKKD